MQNYEVMYLNIIANNLKSLRKRLKLTQEDFAEKLGCTREFISRIENHKENLSLRMILKVSFVFKLDPMELFK